MEIRTLKASEIEARIGSVNKGGVTLLLYKDARVDQNLLDEVFGPYGWQRSHELIGGNLYCTIRVKDPQTGEWISKQDVGTESNTEKEKGQASDSFKRACVNLGIGRELYSAPNLFFPKENLAQYDENDQKCYDKFRVRDIKYTPEKTIAEVTIDCMKYNKVHSTMTFRNDEKVVSMNSAVQKTKAQAVPTTAAAATSSLPDMIADDEQILFGNCRGMLFGEAKKTETYKRFIDWIRNSNTSYEDPRKQRQYLIFKKISMGKGA